MILNDEIVEDCSDTIYVILESSDPNKLFSPDSATITIYDDEGS